MIGRTLAHYKILEKLGEGGMGVVYKAEDTKLKRTVALKFLPPELTHDPEAKICFIQEAQAASALDHPNICTIHEINETEGNQTFICMSYYESETVKKKIEQFESQSCTKPGGTSISTSKSAPDMRSQEISGAPRGRHARFDIWQVIIRIYAKSIYGIMLHLKLFNVLGACFKRRA